jgi:hypothetical protein
VLLARATRELRRDDASSQPAALGELFIRG